MRCYISHTLTPTHTHTHTYTQLDKYRIMIGANEREMNRKEEKRKKEVSNCPCFTLPITVQYNSMYDRHSTALYL